MGGLEEEANYIYEGYQGGGYRGNYYCRNSRNRHDRQPRDDNRPSQPREDDRPTPQTPEKKLEETNFEKTMREFIGTQKSSNEFVRNQFFNLKTKVKQGQKNHQAVIQDLETNGRSYDPPVNLNDKSTHIHDDSDDKVDEVEKEEELMEECYAKLIDMIKEVRINVLLVDVLAGMPNYGKFLKDLVNNKSMMEQISTAFLNEECSAIVQNKLLPKLGDPGSNLIPCTFTNSIECLALSDLGASINLIPYSLYASLFVNTLKPTKMNALLNNFEQFLSTSEKINEKSLDKEFKEFMVVDVEEIPKQEEELNDNFEELTPDEQLRIKTSI
ncbi:hypothetical protein Tco_0143587 [Tanacetum coccineum]